MTLDDYGFETYEENPFPIPYLLTFRTFGTWLHGDERSSIERSRDKRFGTIKLEPNVPLHEKMVSGMKQEPFILTPEQRLVVDMSIKETCAFRGYKPLAINVRSNHAHAVISASVKPEKVVNDLKAYATRRLRERLETFPGEKIWARGASTRYLWKPKFVAAAIEYVLYSQGGVPFEVVEDLPK